MTETAAPAAPPAAAAVEPAPKAPTPAPGDRPFRFTIVKGPEFSLDNLLVKGYVQADIQITPALATTIRTMSVDQIQAIEALANPREETKSLKYIMNLMTIGQIYFSVVAVNGTRLQPPAPEATDRMTDRDPRWKWVKSLAGPLFDQLTAAMTEFDRHAKALVSPEAIKNF